MDTGTCENCGSPEATDTVRRVYSAPPADDRVAIGPDATDGATNGATASPTEETEQWCASCQANYPHLRVIASD